MRFVVEDRFVDFDLNKGIDSNFYQDLISLDSEKSEMHFIASVNQKLVATPDLEALFA